MAQSISLNFLLHSSISLFLRNNFSFLSHQLSRSHELLFQFITTNSLFFQSCLRPTIDALTSHHIHVQLKSSPAQEKSFLSQKKEFLQIFVLQRSTFFCQKSFENHRFQSFAKNLLRDWFDSLNSSLQFFGTELYQYMNWPDKYFSYI